MSFETEDNSGVALIESPTVPSAETTSNSSCLNDKISSGSIAHSVIVEKTTINKQEEKTANA